MTDVINFLLIEKKNYNYIYFYIENVNKNRNKIHILLILFKAVTEKNIWKGFNIFFLNKC
jgi:hypothetical protein